MSGEEVNEMKNEEEPEMTNNEKNEEEPNKEQKEEPKKEATTEPTNTEPTNNETVEEAKPKAKAKATPKKLARSVKVVELAECPDCLKKMLPKSLRNTHPHYCKGQPTETLPVNKQKASYGSKVEQKLRKEIEDEMRAKYEKEKENDKNAQNVKNEVVNYSEPIEVKTKASVSSVPSVSVRMQDTPPPKQLSATELLQQHYNEIKKAKQQEKIEKINRFKSSMF